MNTCIGIHTVIHLEFSAWLGDLAGVDNLEDSDSGRLSFEYLLGKLFVPVAFLMGVPNGDINQVARLIGKKTVVNEFVAFSDLGKLTDADISPRAR